MYLNKVDNTVIYGPTKGLDYELEVIAAIRKPSTIGMRVGIKDANDLHLRRGPLERLERYVSLRTCRAARLTENSTHAISKAWKCVRPLGPIEWQVVRFRPDISPWITMNLR